MTSCKRANGKGRAASRVANQEPPAATGTLPAQLKVCGPTSEQAGPGFLLYLQSLVTSAEAHEVPALRAFTAFVASGCKAGGQPHSDKALAAASARGECLGCASLVQDNAAPHMTWLQICTVMTRIALSTARSSDRVPVLALQFLDALVRSCCGCTIPAEVELQT